MKNTDLVGLVAAPLLVFALSLPAWAADATASTTCKDGTTSSATGKGACSGHGGVQKAATTTAPASSAAPSAPAASMPAASTPAAPAAPASGTPSTCKDGTTSTATGRGACSGHGGVQKGATAPAAAATATAAPAAAASTSAAAPAAAKSSTASKSAPTTTTGNTDPTGATAKCKDGTYSKSQHHSGTCSSHGGVAEWLTATQ
jgi:uncharacterized protein DUF3761